MHDVAAASWQGLRYNWIRTFLNSSNWIDKKKEKCIYSLNLASSAALHLPAIPCMFFGKTKFSNNPLERNPRTANFIMPDIVGIYSGEGNMREDRVTSDWPHVHDQDSDTLKTYTSGVELLFFPLSGSNIWYSLLHCTPSRLPLQSTS